MFLFVWKLYVLYLALFKLLVLESIDSCCFGNEIKPRAYPAGAYHAKRTKYIDISSTYHHIDIGRRCVHTCFSLRRK